MCMMGEFSISGRAFEGMRNLRFLKMYNSGGLRIAGDMEYLPHLRLLHWDVYPGKILPPTFQPQFLVELCMKFSNLEKLWGGIQVGICYFSFEILKKGFMCLCYKKKETVSCVFLICYV